MQSLCVRRTGFALGPLTLSLLILTTLEPGCVFATSNVWKEWKANSSNGATQLPDYSFAGYNYSWNLPPIDRAVTTNASMYGAVGNGVADDTVPLLNAISATPSGGVLYLPAGRYNITAQLIITKPMTVRGAGAASTIIAPDRSLFDVLGLGPCQTGANKGYGWCKGFLEVQSSTNYQTLSAITAAASRGDKVLQVASTSGISIGEEVCISIRDNSSSPTSAMYRYFLGGGRAPNTEKKLSSRTWCSRVEGVSATSVTLQRRLHMDIQLAWEPDLLRAGTSVEQVGIEELAVELPGSPGYPGHHAGFGYNAIELTKCSHCWVYKVRVANADLAFNVRHAYQTTLYNITIEGWRPTDSQGLAGHHGIDLTGSSSVLVSNLNINAIYVHDVTVDGAIGANVITNVYAKAFSADHHGNAPYGNLFDNIYTVSLNRFYISGGASSALPHSGRREVIWNVRGPDGQFLYSQPDATNDWLYPELVISPFGASPSNLSGYADSPAHSSYVLETLAGPADPKALFFEQLKIRNEDADVLPWAMDATTPSTTAAGVARGSCRAPANLSQADPVCATGIIKGQVCCASQCGSCGGSGCSSRPGGAQSCCTGSVTTSNLSCDNHPPPCVMSASAVAKPALACNRPLDCTEGICMPVATSPPSSDAARPQAMTAAALGLITLTATMASLVIL